MRGSAWRAGVRRLHDDLGRRGLDLVPRLYADEIGGDIEVYADGLRAETLPEQSEIYICGMHIVAKQVNLQNDGVGCTISGITCQPAKSGHDGIIYIAMITAHVACSYVRWRDGRAHEDPPRFNGTGLVETDRLYIALTQGAVTDKAIFICRVPDCFWQIAEFF